MLIKKKNNKAEDNSSEGVNETAIDLFASLTAVMMLITSSFFATMTNQTGKSNFGVTKITDRYYLISYGYNDLDKEKAAIKEFENKVNGSLIKIGNHIPSLWKAEDNSKDINVLNISSTKSNISENIFESLNSNMINIIERERIPNIDFTINDTNSYYLKKRVVGYKNTITNGFNNKNIFINIKDIQNFDITFSNLWINEPNTNWANIPLTWECDSFNFKCIIKNPYFSRRCNLGSLDKIYGKLIDKKYQTEQASIHLSEILNFFFKLFATQYLNHACSDPNRTEKVSELEALVLRMKDFDIKQTHKIHNNIFKFKNLVNTSSSWKSAKENECLDYIGGVLSFSECLATVPTGINHAR